MPRYYCLMEIFLFCFFSYTEIWLKFGIACQDCQAKESAVKVSLSRTQRIGFELRQCWLQLQCSNHLTTLLIFSSLKSSNFKKTFYFEVPIFLSLLHCSEIFKFIPDSSPSDFSSLEISNSSLRSQLVHFKKHWITKFFCVFQLMRLPIFKLFKIWSPITKRFLISGLG